VRKEASLRETFVLMGAPVRSVAERVKVGRMRDSMVALEVSSCKFSC